MGAVRLLLVLVLFASTAGATPNTHPPVVPTWDTTSSSLGVAGAVGALPAGTLLSGSYYSTFSSTSGNLSAQFGLHYANRQESGQLVEHGAAGTAALLYSHPLAARFDDGRPHLALGGYVAVAPTLTASGGERNHAWLPLVLGAGLPWSPARWVTLTPWVELGAGATLDTSKSSRPPDKENKDPLSGIDMHLAPTGTVRGGLAVALHAGAFELALGGLVVQTGANFAGPWTGAASASVLLHWDDVVPATLPAERRVQHEDCDAIRKRCTECGTPRCE